MTKSLLVVNYPTLAAADLEKIQSVRRHHDVLYGDVVAPHFTLVFPVFNLDEKSFIDHVKQVTQSIPAFDFVIRCATLGDDAFSDYTHVFLVPDEGHSRIVRLHDQLYTGILVPELRLDIPFIPHIGIANNRDPQVCKTVVDDWNTTHFEMRGKVQQLDVIWYENNQVGTIAQIPLASPL
jgi:2'-5' RNA ligase